MLLAFGLYFCPFGLNVSSTAPVIMATKKYPCGSVSTQGQGGLVVLFELRANFSSGFLSSQVLLA